MLALRSGASAARRLAARAPVSSSLLRLSSSRFSTVTYVEPSGEPVTVTCTAPTAEDSLMTIAIANRIDMEATCNGQLACSTCHVVLDDALFAKLKESHPPTEEELDMLDTAWGLTPTSRLGCQIPFTAIPDGTTVTIPSTR